MKKAILFLLLLPGTLFLFAQGKETVVNIDPAQLGPFCPKKLVTGDRDFAGHGPEIWASVEITYTRSAVVAILKYRAKETGGDNSETSGTTLQILYNVPANTGTYITGVKGGKKAEVHFISKSSVTTFTPGSLARVLNVNGLSVVDKNDGVVKKWEIYGDTNGPDISNDDNCDDDTRILVLLNPLQVTLNQTEAAQGISTINLEDINEWLVPHLTRGDREFDGHGPRVKSEVKLRIGDGGTKLYADVTFWAQETVSDWSTAEGSWSKLVYEAPYGKKITEILSDKASRTQFISPPGGFQVLVPGADLAKALNTFFDATDVQPAVMKAFGAKPEDRGVLQRLVSGTLDHGNTIVRVPPVEGTLVKFFHIVGDTGGPDISDDDNGNDDTRIVKIEFFPVKVKMIDAR